MKKKVSVIFYVGTILLFCVAISGCKKEDTNLKFNHELHIVDNEMACSDCHEMTKDGKMGNPSMDKCAECHDIDVDHPSEECLQCHSVKSASNDYTVEDSTPELPKSYADVTFSHEVHEGIDCDTCHKGMNKDVTLQEIQWPTMKTCQQCHNGDDAPKECDTCHSRLRKDVPPPSHEGDWAEHHGFESRFDKSCRYCHESKQFCQDCHQTHKPKDHIFNWKTTQHGEEATHDRRLCAVCHPASYCSDCHRSQKPVSHARADWMAYTRENGHAEAAKHNFRSCNVCHTTADCNECHQNIILRRSR